MELTYSHIGFFEKKKFTQKESYLVQIPCFEYLLDISLSKKKKKNVMFFEQFKCVIKFLKLFKFLNHFNKTFLFCI